MPATFTPFSPVHGWTVAVGCIAVALLIFAGRCGGKSERAARAILAFLCLSAFGYSHAAWLAVAAGERDLDSVIPLHLCDVASFAAGFALITGSQRLASLAYYWGLAGTVQGLATPAISAGFPHPAYFAFFIHHFAVVGAALYLPLAAGWRPCSPWWRAPVHAWLWALAYAVLAGAANWALGTNFGFLARKPLNPSMLDHLGPWPFYIGWMALVALLFFALLTLPFVRSRRI